MSHYRIGELLSIYSAEEKIVTHNDGTQSSTYDVILKILKKDERYRFCKTYIRQSNKLDNDDKALYDEILLPYKKYEEEEEGEEKERIKTLWDWGGVYNTSGATLNASVYKQDLMLNNFTDYEDQTYGYILWADLLPDTLYEFNLGFCDVEAHYIKIEDTLDPEIDDITELYYYDSDNDQYLLNGSLAFDKNIDYYKQEIIYYPTTEYCSAPLVYKTSSSSIEDIEEKEGNIGVFLETPYLDEIQPAIYDKDANLTFPFLLKSRYQSYNIQIKINSIYDGKTILINNKEFLNYQTDNYEKNIEISPQEMFKERQWMPGVYKIQIRLVGLKTKSNWSNASYIKVLSFKPTLSLLNDMNKIKNIENIESNTHPSFKFSFKSPTDESLKFYYFKILDENKQIIESSGEKTTFYEEIEENSSSIKITATFSPSVILSPLKKYTLICGVETVNKYKEEYYYNFSIIQEKMLTDLNCNLEIKVDTENGKNQIELISSKEQNLLLEGKWELCRYTEEDNFMQPQILAYFKTKDLTINKILYEDYFIESGKEYIYKLQYRNFAGDYTREIIVKNNEKIVNNFEYCFLYCQNKQLKLNLNNSINSFKKNILQSKQDTLGSPYPIIVRNGLTYYAEFPINGLISFHSNDNEFLKEKTKGYYYDNDLVLPRQKYEINITPQDYNFVDNKIVGQKENILNQFNTNISDKNILIERIYRDKVEEFLNDGTLKLFKSPTEGNYIVSLINVAFTPNQQLSRMISSFSCTAYEIFKYNLENLYKANIAVQPKDWEQSDYFSDISFWIHQELNNSKFSIEQDLADFLNNLSKDDREKGYLLHNIKHIAIYNRSDQPMTITFKNLEQISILSNSVFFIPELECNNFLSLEGKQGSIDLIVDTQIFAKRKIIVQNKLPLLTSFNTNDTNSILFYNIELIGDYRKYNENNLITGFYCQGETLNSYNKIIYYNDKKTYEFEIDEIIIEPNSFPYVYSNILKEIPEIHSQMKKWKTTNNLLDWEIENNMYESQLDSYSIFSFKGINLYNLSNTITQLYINNNFISVDSNLYINIQEEDYGEIESMIIPKNCYGTLIATILYKHREGGIYSYG